MTKLSELRAFGAEHAIVLQLIALALACVHAVVAVPFQFYLVTKANQHNIALGLGELSIWPWLMVWAQLVVDLALWVILKLLDARLESSR